MKSLIKNTNSNRYAIGMAIGIPIGMPVGLVLGNLALGPVIGIVIGFILGWVFKFTDAAAEEPDASYLKVNNKILGYVLSFGIAMLIGTILFIWNL